MTFESSKGHPTLIVYHNADLDGVCSAAIAYRALSDSLGGPELYGINYGNPFPWDKVQGRTVCMVDFSLQPFSDMVRVQLEAHEFIWIDHHRAAIDAANEATNACGFDPKGLRVDGIAACELTWRYFTTACPVPPAVRCLGLYDVWKQNDPEMSWRNTILPFQYGVRRLDLRPDSLEWHRLLTPSVNDTGFDLIRREGEFILSYEEQQNALYCKAYAYETTIRPGVHLDAPVYKVLACNKGFCNSDFFESLWDPVKHDLMAAYVYSPKHALWKVSLRTSRDDVDCSAIARSYGGGGHIQAASFLCQALPFINP